MQVGMRARQAVTVATLINQATISISTGTLIENPIWSRGDRVAADWHPAELMQLEVTQRSWSTTVNRGK